MNKRVAVVGGGAAGFFAAINLKEMCPGVQVCILERSARPLAKVEISGGGRCNLTNSFASVGTDLAQVYPRGHRLLGRLFRSFSHRDAYAWFERRGVALVTQSDDCVFPASQDARSISHLFLREARRLGIELHTGVRISSLSDLADYDYVIVAIGGQPRREGLLWLEQPIEEPVPSLFTLSIADERLHELMGTVVPQAQALLPGTRLRASGPLLITHWGMSGPCILRLSSYGARLLSECGYRHPLAVNWLGMSAAEAQQMIAQIISRHPQRLLSTERPDGMQQRLWQYLLEKSLGGRAHAPWGSLNQKEQNRLLNTLTNDTYDVCGRAPHRDEFVTCGGVSLTAVNPQTLESKTHPGLYFAGEVLDIDGVTGGFNFQAAWTTAHAVARAIAAI
ncbi:MAG: aminoacetone oxidase family FAD-binding enzyme [Prevotella sp.]|nr:aminoacetone oxidase family FAD-binding enzyme [Prevotella sp.]